MFGDTEGRLLQLGIQSRNAKLCFSERYEARKVCFIRLEQSRERYAWTDEKVIQMTLGYD